jgi:dTDP-4-amino-4,6-dideoxygalactose transaminase
VSASVSEKPVLAIQGGPRVRTGPWPAWPCYPDDEVEAAAAVLRSGKVNYLQGQEGREFEREFAAYVGCKYAIALANGTVALELALQVLGIGAGDEVVVTPRTFIASASCAVLRSAKPVFADVDPDSQNITAESIRRVLTPRTRAIISVHLAGWPCDMDLIMELAEEHGLKVIEDCAQAHGATYKGRPIGSIGDVGAFSFCQDKIITTGGEGGMLTTNDAGTWERAWSFKDHGKSYDAYYVCQHPPGYRWFHESFGTNWRLTEMQSAIGRAELRKLPEQSQKRRQLAAILDEELAGIPALRLTIPPPEICHAYYRYYAFLRPHRLRPGWTRNLVTDAITAEGVPCITGTCGEIYLEKAFPPELRPAKPLPVAEDLARTSIMLQVHPTLSESDIRDACAAVRKVLSVACI